MSATTDENNWKPCSQGDLSSTIRRIRSKKRQATRLRIGAGGLGSLLILFVASFFFSAGVAEIDCRDVAGRLSEYAAGGLNAEIRRVIEHHLVGCERCRNRLEEMKVSDAIIESVALRPQADQQEQLLSLSDAIPLAIN